MDAVGEWGRGIARAGGVALLLPLALALGVGLSGALGGRDRLRSLGQVLHGPSAPEASRSGSPDLAAAVRVPPLRVRATAPVRRSTGGGQTNTGGSGGGRRTQTPASSTGPGSGGGGSTAPATPPPSSGGGGGSSPAPAPAPNPAPQPNPVRQTGEQVVGVAQQLPAPVGPVAAQTVQTVVDLVAPPRP